MKTLLILSLISLVVSACPAQAAPVLKSFDGYGLEYTIDYPEVKDVSRVIVLIHGSGQHDMDEDLSAVSAGKKNPFFC